MSVAVLLRDRHPFVQQRHDLVELAAAQSRDTARPGDTARRARLRPIRRTATAATICCAREYRAAFAGSRSHRAGRLARPASSARHSTSSSRVSGKSRPFGTAPSEWPARPIRCRNVAIERGEPIWHTKIDVADVDAHFQARRGDDRFELPFLQPLLGRMPHLPREAAVVTRDGFFAEQLRKMMRHALGQPPRVHEHERAAVRLNELRRSARTLRPIARASKRPPAPTAALRGRDRACASGRRRRSRTAACRRLRRCPCRRGSGRSRPSAAAWPRGRCASAASSQSASSRSSDSVRCEPRLSRARAWISSTMTVRTRAQNLAALRRREQQIERLRRGHQNLRRPLEHRLPLAMRACRRCARRRESASGSRPAACAASSISSSGDTRLRRMSLLRALSGET